MLYGDGVFEGIAVYASKAFMLEEHLDRMFNSARALKLKIPLTRTGMKRAINETVATNGLVEGYVRPVITRGPGTLGLNPEFCKRPTVIIIPQRVEDYPLMKIRKPGRAIVSTIRRNPPFCIPASAKTLNYLNNVLAKQEANSAGVGEAIMLDWEGNVSEGTGDNVFLVRDGKVYTPSLDGSILAGITRLVVLRICKKHNIAFLETKVRPEDLYAADEAFLTSTSLEIQPLVEVDGKQIGDGKVGPITKQLMAHFDRVKTSGHVQAA